MALDIGTPAPPFTLRNQRGERLSLDDLAGSKSTLVFIPFAFTSTCEGELCEIRDNLALFEEAATRVVAITCDTFHSNSVWSEGQRFGFDVLSDFWPHGAVSRAYGTFDETYGYAKRTTYFLDEEGIVTDVIASDELRVARPFALYERALSART